MLNKNSEFISKSQNEVDKEEEKEIGQRKTLKIGDKFWSKLRIKIGSRIGNPNYVDVVFRSTHKRI